jgi:hypothetical protein
MRKIKKVLNEYNDDLRKTLDEDEELDILFDKYKERLFEIVEDEKLLANYCIKVAYRSMSSDKSLCWMLFGDEMIDNLRENSDERKELELVETNKKDEEGQEFLGKYYKLVNKGL